MSHRIQSHHITDKESEAERSDLPKVVTAEAVPVGISMAEQGKRVSRLLKCLHLLHTLCTPRPALSRVALPGPGLGCSISSSRHWYLALYSVVMFPKTSQWLLTYTPSPLFLPLLNLYLVTYPPKWRWFHMKMTVEQDEGRFCRPVSGNTAHVFVCYLRGSDFNGGNVDDDGREGERYTEYGAEIFIGIRVSHSLWNHQPSLTLPVERQATCRSTKDGKELPSMHCSPFPQPQWSWRASAGCTGNRFRGLLNTVFQAAPPNWLQLAAGIKTYLPPPVLLKSL